MFTKIISKREYLKVMKIEKLFVYENYGDGRIFQSGDRKNAKQLTDIKFRRDYLKRDKEGKGGKVKENNDISTSTRRALI